jgi:hypothetical protein
LQEEQNKGKVYLDNGLSMTRGEWKNQGHFIQKRIQDSRRHILNNIKNAWDHTKGLAIGKSK